MNMQWFIGSEPSHEQPELGFGITWIQTVLYRSGFILLRIYSAWVIEFLPRQGIIRISVSMPAPAALNKF